MAGDCCVVRLPSQRGGHQRKDRDVHAKSREKRASHHKREGVTTKTKFLGTKTLSQIPLNQIWRAESLNF